MADYWKSQPRKFCDFCKCWIADNKPSIEFHEKGKKHQENVRQKLSEIGKKGQKMWKDKQKYDSMMADMERNAMAAFKKDLERDTDLASHYHQRLSEMPSVSHNVLRNEDISVIPLPGPDYGYGKPEPKAKSQKPMKEGGKQNQKSKEKGNFKKEKRKDQQGKSKEQKPEKQWYEARSEEGHSYYWHIYTGESVWSPPEEGYLSLEEQAKTSDTTDGTSSGANCDQETKEFEEEREEPERKNTHETPAESEDKRNCSSSYVPEFTYGPSVRPNPYGEWQPVVEPVTGPLKLDLPEKREPYKQFVVEEPEEEYTFAERTLSEGMGSKNDTGGVSFKRRNVQGSRRNVRKRGDDD